MKEKVIIALEWNHVETVSNQLDKTIELCSSGVNPMAKLFSALTLQLSKKFKPELVFRYEGEKNFTIKTPNAIWLMLLLKKNIGDDDGSYRYNLYKSIISSIETQTA